MHSLTPEKLREALRGWQMGLVAPDDLLALRLLDEVERDQRLVRDALLYEQVERVTLSQIEWYLPGEVTAKPLPERLRDFEQSLAAVPESRFARGAAWVTLYYRWILPDGLTTDQMAVAANVSPRQIRRLVYRGLCLLARQLRQNELHHWR